MLRVTVFVLAFSTSCVHVQKPVPCSHGQHAARWVSSSTEVHLYAEPALVEAARAAAIAWHSPGAPVIVVYTASGTIPADIVSNDRVSRLGVERQEPWPFNAAFAAATERWPTDDGRYVDEADVAVNPGKLEPRFDPQAVLTHEFGHVLGLPDSDDPLDTMFCLVLPLRHDVGDGDRAALKALYR